MNHQKEAFFSLGSYRGYSLFIYVYIHFQYFPAEKLIVHVNGYSFRLGISYRKYSVRIFHMLTVEHIVRNSLNIKYIRNQSYQIVRNKLQFKVFKKHFGLRLFLQCSGEFILTFLPQFPSFLPVKQRRTVRSQTSFKWCFTKKLQLFSANVQ